MRKTWASVFIAGCFFFSQAVMSYAEIEQYTITKIKLGEYEVQNGHPLIGDYSVRWWELEPFNIAVDDEHNIYVLDVFNRKVIKLMPNGNFTKQIDLKDITFPYTDRNKEDGYMNYLIQVSSDGSFIYVIGGFNEYYWTIYDSNGRILKKDVQVFSAFKRMCNDRFATDSQILDTSLKPVKQVTKHVVDGEIFDSEYNFYAIDNLSSDISFLIKKTGKRQDIWKREFKGYQKAIRLLSVDGKDNIYVLMDGPPAVIKLNKKGELIATILLPNDRVFANRAFSKGIFEILCDGGIYYFPPYLGPSTEEKKTKREYAIYRFQRKDSLLSPSVSPNMFEDALDLIANMFKSKNYEGNVKIYSDIASMMPQATGDTRKIYVKVLRNEIYARHGRIFTTPEMTHIFESAPWYKPRKDFKETDLNEMEKKNVEFILEYEKKMGWK